MKTLTLTMLLILSISCGKKSNGDATRDIAEANTTDVDISLEQADPPDLLNVTMDEKVTINGNQIVFSRAKALSNAGEKITCALSVQTGETWTYQVNGNSLNLQMSDGTQMDMKKISSNGSGIQGSWIWTKNANAIKIIRRLSVVNDQLILNQDCEG